MKPAGMRFLISLLISIVFVCCDVAAAQAPTAGEVMAIEDQIAERTRLLEDIQLRLEDEVLTSEDLVSLAEVARSLRQESLGASQPINQRLAVLRSDLSRLGPAPEEGMPAEPEAVRLQRTDFETRIAELETLNAAVALNLSAAERITDDIASRRREAFTGRVLARGPSLFAPHQWEEAAATFFAGVSKVERGAEAWWQRLGERGVRGRSLWMLLGALGLAIALMVPVRRYLQRQVFARVEALEPYPSRRVLLAALRTAIRVLPGVLAGLFVYEAAKAGGLIAESAAPLARAIWLGFIILLFADGAGSAVFAPKQPTWRVARLSTQSVSVIRVLLTVAAAVWVSDLMLGAGAAVLGSSPALDYVQHGIIGVALAVLLFLLAQDRLWAEYEPGADAQETSADTGALSVRERPLWTRLRLGARVLSVAALVGPVLGFVSFSHYVGTRVFAILALLGLVISFRALMREGVRLLDRRFSQRESEDSEAGSERVLYSWIGITIEVVAVAIFIPPALLVLGAEWSDVRGWMVDAIVGFQIGGVQISFGKILSALGLFVLLLWLTRQAQKTAETTFFPRSRIDVGVQNSLKTLMGYVGLVIAFSAAIGTLGFNLQNLAIIAGALSVGIGFGLQSIVNNFVSGLILLFERPIKVGDWVVTTSGEGIVKRISVRSTEIETFDRSSVIVPNSELISQAVTNWTHKNRMGRVIVRVGTSYDSDSARVIAILEEVAKSLPEVLTDPAPFAVFEDFGASSLDFSIRAFIQDVSRSLTIRTQLRVAIHERFKAEGIEIPFPQRDLNLRNVPSGFMGREDAAPDEGAA